MRFLASTLPILILLVLVCGSALANTSEQPRTFELSDGRSVVAVVIDQLETAYLVRTAEGETLQLRYEDVLRVSDSPQSEAIEQPATEAAEGTEPEPEPEAGAAEQPKAGTTEGTGARENEKSSYDQDWSSGEPVGAAELAGEEPSTRKNKCRVMLALGSGAAIHSVASFVGGFTAAAVFAFGTTSANFWGGSFAPAVTGDHLPSLYGDQYTPAFSTGMALIGVSMSMLGVGHELGKKSLWESTWRSRRSTKAGATLVSLGYPLWFIGYGGFIASYVLLTQNIENYEETLIAPPIVSAVLMVLGHGLAAGGVLKVHQAAADSVSTMPESSVGRPPRTAPRLALSPWIAPRKSGLSLGLGGVF